MHEVRIAQDLSAIVLETARRENLSVVSKVNIVFGKLIQIVPDIFDFVFREAVRDSIADKADLNIEIIEIELRCRRCNNEFFPQGEGFLCNNCGSEETDIIKGKELYVKSIEGE